MSEQYAVMPMEDWQNIVDSVKAKTGKANGLVSGEVSTEIDSIQTGGGGVPVQRKEVNFVDYDNTLLYSYTISEAQALTEMPPLPTRNGLICQGWNFELEQIQQNDKKLDIGATYITDDGKTRLYITIAAEGRMEVPLYFLQTISDGVKIDWGDGSGIETISGTEAVNTAHSYSKIGDYIISLDVVDGCNLELGHYSSNVFVLGTREEQDAVYLNMLQKVELGQNITSIGDYTFYNCCSLSSIVIPESVTSIGNYAFYKCYSLSSVVIPKSFTSTGNYTFYNCYSLSSIVIPESVTSIGNYAFYNCYSLSSVVFPESVTNINRNAFSECYSLSNIVIPKSVTSIGVTAFYGCYGMRFYDFTRHTSIPYLSSSNAFNGIPSDCEIRVPSELIEEWKSATNWSTFADKIVAR